jgi:hypothetical protein
MFAMTGASLQRERGGCRHVKAKAFIERKEVLTNRETCFDKYIMRHYMWVMDLKDAARLYLKIGPKLGNKIHSWANRKFSFLRCQKVFTII